MTSQAGSVLWPCPAPSGTWPRRLPARRSISLPRLHNPSISPPLPSAAHHHVVGPRAVFAPPPCPHRYPLRRLHDHGRLPPRVGASRGASRPLQPSDPRRSCMCAYAALYPPTTESTPCCLRCVSCRIADTITAPPITVAGRPPPGVPPRVPFASRQIRRRRRAWAARLATFRSLGGTAGHHTG